jgi:gliding motility-associated lipoprotein GldH
MPTRKSQFALWLLALVTLLTLSACDDNTIYSHYESTSLAGWERGDTLHFKNIVVKATTDYKEEIGLRINDSFPFMSLFLVVEQHVRPRHVVRMDTLSCRLVDKDGHVKGRGLSFYQYNFHLTTLQLQAGDTLDISVRHNMKRESLPGIANVGMTISRNK